METDAAIETTDHATRLLGLDRALVARSARGDEAPLNRWLARELDADGRPRRLGVESWWAALELLERAWPSGRKAPERPGEVIAGLVRAALRFARPDGSAMFGPPGPPTGRPRLIRSWVGRIDDPGPSVVAHWWFPGASPRGRRGPAAPPLPSDSAPDRPLAILRADWTRRGDWLAIDHRGAGLVEIAGRDRLWLGPGWSSTPSPTGRARPRAWSTGPLADGCEWAFRAGDSRVVRTAVLLRGRSAALLADQIDRPGESHAVGLDLGPGVTASPVPGSRALRLTSDRGGSALVLPLGLPAEPYPTPWGGLHVEGRRLVLRQRSSGRRLWLPLLISWDPAHLRRPVSWRPLTVSERSRACALDVAFAARVSWGPAESLVVYRGLSRPAPRAFLGHSTTARFLVGRFTREGNVDALLKLEGGR